MLSKILRDEEASSVQPLAWRTRGGPVIAGPAPAATVPASSQQPAPFKPLNPDQEIAALQARIVELQAAAERRVRETREAAYREGETAGRNQATAQIQPMLNKLAQSIHEIAELRPKLRHEAEADLVKLSLAIARKILHRELIADPESISGLIRVAMDKIRLQEILKVRVHPQHHAAVQQALTQISIGTRIEITPDPKLQLGGVVVETTRGEFDASVDLQLREIERGLTDRLAHAQK